MREGRGDVCMFACVCACVCVQLFISVFQRFTVRFPPFLHMLLFNKLLLIRNAVQTSVMTISVILGPNFCFRNKHMYENSF